MKKFKLVLFSLILCFGMVLVSACKEEEPILADGIYLTETSLELTLGDFATIGVNITPNEATNKDFEVSALTKDILTIDCDKENMQFTVSAPNEITNGFDTVELEVKTLDGSNLNTHLTVTLKERVTPIDAPKDLHYNGSELEWTEVLGAKGYIVNINGTDMPVVYTNKFALDDNLVGADIVARVYAVAEDDSLSSGFSEYTFKILSAPTNLSYENGTISWDAVDGATGYNVYFDGKLSFITYTQCYVLDRFSEPKTYQIKVKAVGSDENKIEDSNFCDLIEVTKLDTPKNIRINNGVVLWDAVLNASAYKLYLDDNQPINTNLTRLVLPQSLTAGLHSFKMETLGDEKTYISSFLSAELKFEKLQTIGRMYIENGLICWDANLQATSYAIYVDGTPYQTTNVDVTSIDFADYNSGTYNLNIKAIGNGGNILDSNLMSQNFEVTKLATPNNLQILKDETGSYVAWDAVENASAYLVEINDNEPIVVEDNKYLLQVENGTYNIKVKALGDNSKFVNSNYSNTFVTTKLANVSGLTVNNGQVVWNSIVGAGKYIVLINNDVKVETVNNKFDMQSNGELQLDAGVYTISVMAVASNTANIESDYCTAISVTKLAVPNISVKYGALVDAQIPNSSEIKYTIKTISATGETINTQTKNSLASVGSDLYQKYEITAKAIAKNPTSDENVLYVNSDESNAFVCIQLPKITDISMIDGVASFGETTYQNLNEGFAIKMEVVDTNNDDESTNTSVYDLRATQRSYDFKSTAVGKYSYKFTAVSNYNENGESLQNEPYLTSRTSQENTFTVLSAPENAKISSIADYVTSLDELIEKIDYINSNPSGLLIWDKVDDATKYSISIDGVEKLVTTSLSSNLIGILSDDGNEHEITVQSIGNGKDIISSPLSEEIACVKLNRPSNLQCGGNYISWDSEYNEGLSIFSLLSETANIVLYVAQINNNEYVTLNTNNISADNIASRLSSKQYILPKLKAGDYVTRVYAIPLNSYMTISGEVLEKSGTKYVMSELNSDELYISTLNAPQNLNMSLVDGKQLLQWSPLQYQNGELKNYVVVQQIGDNATIDNVANNVTQWEFKDYSPNTYLFGVYAKANGGSYHEVNGRKYYYVDSYYSNTVETTVMQSPDLSVKQGVVCWNEITGADNYVLTFGKAGGSQETLTFDAKTTSFALGDKYTSGDYTFKILAKGDGVDYITSEYSTEKTFTKLSAVENLRLENGVFVYDENSIVASTSNDCYYKLVVNSKELSNNKLLATELGGFAGGNYSICVYAFGDNNKYLTSNVSETIECIKLASPTNVSIKSGMLTWDRSNNSTSYQLDVAGKVITDITGVAYDLSDLQCGDYEVKVKAIGNSLSYLNSDWTQSKTISKLDEIKNLRVENGVITWDRVSGSYKDIRLKIKLSADVNYSEVKIDSSATSYVLDDTYSAGTYNVCMYNAGGASAISSSESEVITVVKLSSPTNLQVTTEGDAQYLEFDSVANASGYVLNINDYSIDITSTKIATDVLKDLGISIDTSGTYVIKVMASGTKDGSATTYYANSDYSASLTITKPAAPVLEDVKTTENKSSGMVRWNAVENADFYRVVIIKDDKIDEANTFTTENTYIYVSNSANYTVKVTACKTLNGFDSETSEITLSYSLYSGSGTEDDPYAIKTAVDFNNITYNLTAYYQLQNDIDFSATVFNLVTSTTNPFVGTIDGNNYKISGISLKTYSELNSLIKVLGKGGKICNLTVDISITSGQTVGGIVALNYGTIENCVVNGTVSPVYNVNSVTLQAGGIVGINYGEIKNCVNNASINPQNNMNLTHAGGIASYNYGTISGCGNNADVKAIYAGGITAYSTGDLTYCYNNFDASVTAAAFNNGFSCSAYAGGIVGYITTDTVNSIKVYNCYNVGSVKATSQYNAVYPYAGGLVGYNAGAKIDNCYSTNVDADGNVIVSVATANNGKGYAGILVGYNEKGTITSNNVSVCQNTNQVEAYSGSGTISRTKFLYSEIDETTILNNLSGYEATENIYPIIKNNVKY